MPKHTFHFLNVKDGDCSIIEHGSGRVSVVDVCNAEKVTQPMTDSELQYLAEGAKYVEGAKVRGNFQQKKYPVNPVDYLNTFNIESVFRFILTHPDMDHMDGIEDFFECFSPINFWDTANEKEMEFEEGSRFSESDWNFYKKIRDEDPQADPKRLVLYSDDQGKYWTQNDDGNPPGDKIQILAPTPDLLKQAIEIDNYNDASYVLLYTGDGGARVILSGDSHDNTWEHILDNWNDAVKDVDLLIAPHHGRKSDRSYDFLDTVNPKMTFFGNAPSGDLAYDAWNYRKLEHITNNEANCMVVDCRGEYLTLYVTYENFAKTCNSDSYYAEKYKAWFVKEIVGWDMQE